MLEYGTLETLVTRFVEVFLTGLFLSLLTTYSKYNFSDLLGIGNSFKVSLLIN